MDATKELMAARMALTDYMDKHRMRHTHERFAILEKIFGLTEHFSVDDLFKIMCDSECRVSRATVYNSIELLERAGLVRKHRFDNRTAQYEKVNCISSVSHHHLICRVCGKVREMRDSEAVKAIENRQFASFKTDYVQLYVYGVCSRCQHKQRQQREDK